MMMCTRCKKRPAVVFVSGSTDAQQSQGYCLVCAKELGIKPVNDLMEKMGITEEMMESMESELSGLMSMDGAMMPKIYSKVLMERKQQKSRKKQILPPEKQTIRKRKNGNI